jgi:nucleoside 2-deoxyribosyltransferase
MSRDQIRVYIAAPFFNPDQLAIVERIESMLKGKRIPYHSPREEGVLTKMEDHTRAEKGAVIYDVNINGLEWCTHLIAVIDDYDTGTVWEMGYAHAKGKGIFTYSSQQYGINIMLEQSILSHCQTTKELSEYRGKHNGELT